MILRMNIELETSDMTLLEFAGVVDKITHAAGVKGRIRCSLGRVEPRDIDLAGILTQPEKEAGQCPEGYSLGAYGPGCPSPKEDVLSEANDPDSYIDDEPSGGPP